MTKQLTRRVSTMGRNPFDSVIPERIEESPAPSQSTISMNGIARREKLSVTLDHDLINRVKNAAYWNPRLTIAKIAEQGIRQAIDEIERENGGRYKQRESSLKSGHPMK